MASSGLFLRRKDPVIAIRRLTAVLAMTIAAAACGGGSSSNSTPAASQAPSAPRPPVSMDKASYPVFPNADAGADPSVPAEQGGKGFTGQGWETNSNFDLCGDPRAVKGGLIRDFMLDFPGTLRLQGPESNSAFNYGITSMLYEALLGTDYRTLEFVPGLATHWQISPDKMTYRFRINPNPRFSDGTPVTADDVVAPYYFLMDK